MSFVSVPGFERAESSWEGPVVVFYSPFSLGFGAWWLLESKEHLLGRKFP